MNWFTHKPPPAPDSWPHPHQTPPPLAANDYEARVLGLVKLIEQHEQRLAALEAWQTRRDEHEAQR